MDGWRFLQSISQGSQESSELDSNPFGTPHVYEICVSCPDGSRKLRLGMSVMCFGQQSSSTHWSLGFVMNALFLFVMCVLVCKASVSFWWDFELTSLGDIQHLCVWRLSRPLLTCYVVFSPVAKMWAKKSSDDWPGTPEPCFWMFVGMLMGLSCFEGTLFVFVF